MNDQFQLSKKYIFHVVFDRFILNLDKEKRIEVYVLTHRVHK
jgi:hypothetical protein